MIETNLEVNIPDSDKINFREFGEGNPVQVRVTIPSEKEIEYKKGKIVKVIHLGHRASGKIVSDAIVIDERKDEGLKILSLVIAKLQD